MMPACLDEVNPVDAELLWFFDDYEDGPPDPENFRPDVEAAFRSGYLAGAEGLASMIGGWDCDELPDDDYVYPDQLADESRAKRQAVKESFRVEVDGVNQYRDGYQTEAAYARGFDQAIQVHLCFWRVVEDDVHRAAFGRWLDDVREWVDREPGRFVGPPHLPNYGPDNYGELRRKYLHDVAGRAMFHDRMSCDECGEFCPDVEAKHCPECGVIFPNSRRPKKKATHAAPVADKWAIPPGAQSKPSPLDNLPAVESPPPRFPFLTSAELANGDFELTYLIDGLLVAGQPGGIFGPRKSLKTNIFIDLALSLGTGWPFLGHFNVTKPVRVALLSGESGRSTIQETARRICRAKRWSLDQVENLIWAFDLPNLGDAVDHGHLRAFIETNRLEVLIIDPTYLCMPVGEAAGNLFVVGGLLKALTALGQSTGCTILLCHHAKKRGKFDPYEVPELDDIAWAGFQEWVRQWVLLGRRAAYDPDQGGHHELWLNAGGSAGHSSLWAINVDEGTRQDAGGRRWDVEVITAKQARAAASTAVLTARETAKDAARTAKAEADRAKLLDAMKQCPDGETARTLGVMAGVRDAAPILAAMAYEKLVERVELTKNRRKENGFKPA